eukprot:m.109652 g.109652  ORF g.109652 m.109652 type:complete len:663 (-) comp19154_c0_seq1:83-2071(-)
MMAESSEVKRSGSKELKKGLFVQQYESFFRGEDPSKEKETFWEELLLLKVNVPFLESKLAELTDQDMLLLKNGVNVIVHSCIQHLTDDNQIRVANSIQTLALVARGVFSKAFANYGFDAINVFVGFDVAEAVTKTLCDGLKQLLLPTANGELRNLALNLLMVFVTLTDNINNNCLLEYLMLHSLFEPFVEIMRYRESREQSGFHALCLLAILVNYHKYEAPNPYVRGLAELSDDVVLNAIGSVAVKTLSERSRRWSASAAPRTEGFFGSMGRLVETLFVAADEEKCVRTTVSGAAGVLLGLYETVQLNPHFATVLTHTQVYGAKDSPPRGVKSSAAAAAGSADEPSTLLSSFFTFMSLLLQDPRDKATLAYSKLGFAILTCVTEDAHANAFLHDPNINVPVVLHKAAMRHRPSTTEVMDNGPLACPLLELCIEFLISHLKKNLAADLYSKCLGVVHRLLCYQKKHRVRLPYRWKQLWAALVGLVKFILANEKLLSSHGNVLGLCDQVVTIFNLFITYGDTFLPDPNSYDELYYEIIREHSTFDSLCDAAKRHMRAGGQWQVMASKLAGDVVNIRAITTHFTPKIDSWFAKHGGTLTPEQVLAVVRDNYDTLTLKLQDNLDQYEKYAENPNERVFFGELLELVVAAHRAVNLSVHHVKVTDNL